MILKQMPTIWREKIPKIGPVDPAIISLQEIFKKTKKRKRWTQAKHIARQARMPGGLNKGVGGRQVVLG